eukprot:scaffold25842_cov198-Amphora_coffeaeformis.AAC.17
MRKRMNYCSLRSSRHNAFDGLDKPYQYGTKLNLGGKYDPSMVTREGNKFNAIYNHGILSDLFTPLTDICCVRGGGSVGNGWKEWGPELSDNVLVGSFKAFIWFQGESDAFVNPGPTYKEYKSNLTEVVLWSLSTIHNQGLTAMNFPTKEDIPVVIVEIGHHPLFNIEEEYGWIQNVRKDFVQELQSAETGQYSRHYHLDAPRYTLLGDKIAQEVARLLNLGTISPTASPVADPCSACDGQFCETVCSNACYYMNGNPSVQGCQPIESGGDPNTTPVPVAVDCTTCSEISNKSVSQSYSPSGFWQNGSQSARGLWYFIAICTGNCIGNFQGSDSELKKMPTYCVYGHEWLQQHRMMHVKALVGRALVGVPHFASMPNSSERTICSGLGTPLVVVYSAKRIGEGLIDPENGVSCTLRGQKLRKVLYSTSYKVPIRYCSCFDNMMKGRVQHTLVVPIERAM